MDFAPFEITLKLAFLTTMILLVVGIPLAYFLAYKKWKILYIVESLVMLPLVLPPTVLGYYYLLSLGPTSSVGRFLYENFNVELAFSFTGILIGSLIYCIPFMISPLVNGYRSIPNHLISSARTMGKSRFNILFKVILPNMKRQLWTAILLTFAHTMGEFGVVLMIGGNFPETKTASIAIYDELNSMNYDDANIYAITLLGISVVLIFIITLLTRNSKSIA